DGEVGDVAVGEDDMINLVAADQRLQFLFRIDGNAVWITRAAENRRVSPVGDPWNLRGGKSHHLIVGVVTEIGVECVKVATGCSQDQDPFARHTSASSGLRLSRFC